MNADAIQSVIRAAMKIGGGYLVSKGVTDSATWEAIAGGVLALFALIWGIRHRSPPAAPGASRPGLLTGPLLVFALASFLSLVVGCASRNSRVFQFERDVLASARSQVSAWNTRSSLRTNALLELRTSQIHSAARQLSVRLLSLHTLRERALTNGVEWPAVELEQQAVRAAHSNLTWLVEDGMKGVQ